MKRKALRVRDNCLFVKRVAKNTIYIQSLILRKNMKLEKEWSIRTNTCKYSLGEREKYINFVHINVILHEIFLSWSVESDFRTFWYGKGTKITCWPLLMSVLWHIKAWEELRQCFFRANKGRFGTKISVRNSARYFFVLFAPCLGRKVKRVTSPLYYIKLFVRVIFCVIFAPIICDRTFLLRINYEHETALMNLN